MVEAEPKLAAEVAAWLKTAGQTDQSEDRACGAERRGDETPDWVAGKQRRLAKIREAKPAPGSEQGAALKAEAQAAAAKAGGPSIPDELARREERLAKLAAARAAIAKRAKDRFAREETAYEAKLAARAAKAKKTGKKPGGKPPEPPQDGPLPTDQINLTDAASRVMPVPDGGFEQCYNAQAAVAADSLLVVHRLATPEGKKLYALRKQVPEPVFGIIKSVLAFRQFLLRGLDKSLPPAEAGVRGEWSLATMAWSLKRMFALGLAK